MIRSRFVAALVLAATALLSPFGFAQEAPVEAFDAALATYTEAKIAVATGDGEAASALEAAKVNLRTAMRDAVDALEEAGDGDRADAIEGQFTIATGEIVSWPAVVALAEHKFELALAWVASDGPSFLGKLIVIVAIWIAFKLIANAIGRATRRALSTEKIKASSLLKEFTIGIAEKAVLAVGVLVILTQVGMEIGPLLAGLGVAGFVLGFALQDSLGNFAAGMMVLFYRPYDIGDWVNAGGVTGKVDAMSLVSTTVLTADNQRLIVPNGKIWGDVITNVTANATRRVDLTFGIGYGDDIAHAERVLREVVEAHELVLAEPAPLIKVHELAESSVNLIVRPWVKTSDYWAVYWDLTRAVKERFDAEGISIPFPQRDVHLHAVEPAPAAAPSSGGAVGASQTEPSRA